MGGAGAWCDVDEMGRFDDLDAVPHALGHDEYLTGPERVAGLGSRMVEVAVVEDDNESAGDEIQELVTVGMELTAMRGWGFHAFDDADGEAVDANGFSAASGRWPKSRRAGASLPIRRTQTLTRPHDGRRREAARRMRPLASRG